MKSILARGVAAFAGAFLLPMTGAIGQVAIDERPDSIRRTSMPLSTDGTQTRSVAAGRTAVTGSPSRIVGNNELTDGRSKTEDDLRRGLLSLFSDETTLKEIRDILNRPWDKNGLNYLGSLKVWDPQLGAVISLLAYVSGAYAQDKVISAEACYAVGTVLERVIDEFRERRADYKMASSVRSSLEKHGNPQLLLLPAFWKAIAQNNCLHLLSVIVRYGNEETLVELKAFRPNCRWPETQLRSLDETILILDEAIKHPDQAEGLRNLNDEYARRLTRAEALWRHDNPDSGGWTAESDRNRTDR